jgi:hypothetical protein
MLRRLHISLTGRLKACWHMLGSLVPNLVICMDSYSYCRVILVTTDGVWIGNWIYCSLTTRNCNLQFTISHTSLLSFLRPPLVVAWLQSANKGYSSRPWSLRTALTNHRRQRRSESESRYDRRSAGQSVLVSSPVWGSWPDVTYC